MAAVLPLRPNHDSTGTSATGNKNSSTTGRPSLASFPSRVRSGSHSTQNDSINLTVGGHIHHASNPSSAHSHHSSVHRWHPSSPQRRPMRSTRPVKSQYPADSTEKHVEYILVASFDIDRGSVMEHQYPGPVGGDEHMLAELMLPDQAHVRSQDWTIFFLHKDATVDEEDRSKRRRRQKQSAGDDSDPENVTTQNGFDFGLDDVDVDEEDDEDDEPSENMDGPPLVYVLNLVNTKQDNTVKRGAVVKAMAICTRHSFLHIYKPLLLLALEQYFANPVVETLAGLYDAVNSMDLSLMPKLTFLEKTLLQGTDAKDMFLEKFETMIEQRVQETEKEDALLASADPSNAAQFQFRARYGLPRDTHEFESIVNYTNVPVPVKIPTAVSPETVGDFSLVKLISTFSNASTSPFNPTHPHLTTSGPNTHPIIVLLNAVLTQKRVIFLGHNLPSSEVAEAVLAACSLASGGWLRGFTRHAFPYTDLTKIDDLLKVPGFIAGVTNPAFGHKTEWWDLLCDLSTGRMRISNRIEQAPLTEGAVYFQNNPHVNMSTNTSQSGISAFVNAGASLSAGLGGSNVPTGSVHGDATGDAAFMQSILVAIQERHGESAIRSKFRKWVLKFTRLAASFEETVYGASTLHVHSPDSPTLPFTAESPGVESPGPIELTQEVLGHGYVWTTPQAKNNELAANATRIEGWRNTRSYYNFIHDLATYYIHRPVKNIDVQHLHDMLAKLRLGQDQSAHLYQAICNTIHSEQEVCYLLSIIANGVWENKPTASGSWSNHGLLYIAMGLFHQRLEVREDVAELLVRIRDHEAGKVFFQPLGRFVKIAFERVLAAKMERLDMRDER